MILHFSMYTRLIPQTEYPDIFLVISCNNNHPLYIDSLSMFGSDNFPEPEYGHNIFLSQLIFY